MQSHERSDLELGRVEILYLLKTRFKGIFKGIFLMKYKSLYVSEMKVTLFPTDVRVKKKPKAS